MKPRAQHIAVMIGVLCCLLLSAAPQGVAAQTARQKVFVIPVTGDVEPAMAAYIKRVVRDTAEYPNAVLVFELDTFGGRVDAALNIVETLVHVGPPRRTIAFVTTKAISAGALIALACDDLVMRPHTTIGDCAPITYSDEGPKMMGEKFQSPLRAKFRTLARRNHYPPTLAESMVSADMEVYEVELNGKKLYLDSKEYEELPPAEKDKVRSKKTIVAKGELLTMDDAEALALGFSRQTASSVEEMLKGFGITNYEIIRVDESWSESLGRLIARFSPILLMVGLGALYIELKAPGFGLPGILGVVCLGLVFLNQYLVGLADYTELLLVMLGVIFLAMEVFVLPGFGLAGLVGFFFIAVGMILSFQDFVVPDPSLPWQQDILTNNIIQVLGSFLFALAMSLLFLRYVFPRLGRVVEGPYLASTLAGSKADSLEAKGVRAGDIGTVVTFLRPAGKMERGKDIIDVVSEGEFLEKGTPVVVSEIQGNRVIVKRSEK